MSIPAFDWKAEVRRRIRHVPLAGERQAAIVEEIAQDLEARHGALLQDGMDDLVARAQVLGDLDNGPGLDHYLSHLERQLSPVSSRLDGRGSAAESLLQDGRFAVRAFRRRPLFTSVAVVAIAIGVASLTTVFSLLNAVLIRALPLSRFEDVVMVWQQDLTTGRDRMTLSAMEWQAYGRTRSFDAVAAIRGVRLSIGTGGTPLAVSGLQISSELFNTLGVTPILGRGLSRSREAATDEVVITSEFWRTHFGADPAVLGRALTIRAGFTADPDALRFIDGTRLVVGVLPDGVSLPYRAADVWLPLPPQVETVASGASAGLLVFARLAPGVTLPAASAETATIARRLLAQFPERNPHVESRLVTLREEVVGDVTPTLILLSAAVMLLSLIVCANVGNMLLSRLTERQREITVRRALGATRGRLVQQLLTESVVLGASGGALGVLLSYWLLRALATAGPATIPRVGDLRLDLWTLGAAVVASIVMSIVFGLLPALRIVRTRGNQLAQRSGNTAQAGRLREWLTIAEFALAFMVLVGAGLVYVSARALETTSVGYDPTSSLTLRVALPQDGYARPEQRAAFFETLLDRFGGLPGVTHAGAVSILPQMDTNRTLAFDLDSAASGAAPDRPSARFRVATPGYFESLGIRVVQGRTFQRSDLATGAVVVSQSLAARFWPSVDPVGRQVRLALPAGPGPWLTVVGVVDDVRQWINTPSDPTLYWANTQQAEFAFVLRTAADPSTLSTAAARVVRDLDPQQPVFDVQTMRERLDRSQQLTYERFRATIIGAFGLIALLLAGLGIYGVVRYAVVQRTQEFGIRIALGSSSREVFGIVLRQSLRSTFVGCAIGLVGSIVVGRLLASVLYGGVGAQPIITVAVAALLAAISAAAAAGPARWASRVDPLIALRSE
jgi:putative ABC transport system permease protein